MFGSAKIDLTERFVGVTAPHSKCTSVNVYLLLKSSDFITHALSVESVFGGCTTGDPPTYELELVLRSWYPADIVVMSDCLCRMACLLLQQFNRQLGQLFTTTGRMPSGPTRKRIKFSICYYHATFRADTSSILIPPRTSPFFTYEELHEVLSKVIQDPSARRTFLPNLTEGCRSRH
ncbi:hypothetical protein EDC04DRAFT_1768129 [Pisolithus marmoratus]|nr:hypothetical protein EDC04DRAFT_1768129 [Pisolithus marmoratus]